MRSLVAFAALALGGVPAPRDAERPRTTQDPMGEAHVDEAAPTRSWHLGLNLRTDFGAHPLRVGAGVMLDDLDLTLVLDPMVFLDNQHDMDLVAQCRLLPSWWLLMGWRATAIGILDGYQWQHKSLLGVSAELPALYEPHVRAQAGVELVLLWVKHGGGLEIEPISLASARDWLDHVNFTMFFRVDFHAPF